MKKSRGRALMEKGVGIKMGGESLSPVIWSGEGREGREDINSDGVRERGGGGVGACRISGGCRDVRLRGWERADNHLLQPREAKTHTERERDRDRERERERLASAVGET